MTSHASVSLIPNFEYLCEVERQEDNGRTGTYVSIRAISDARTRLVGAELVG